MGADGLAVNAAPEIRHLGSLGTCASTRRSFGSESFTRTGDVCARKTRSGTVQKGDLNRCNSNVIIIMILLIFLLLNHHHHYRPLLANH